MPDFTSRVFRLFERDLLTRIRRRREATRKLCIRATLVLPLRSDQDYNALKASHFMRSLIPLNAARLSIRRARNSRRKLLIFSFVLRGRFADLFLDRFLSWYLPSLIRRQAPFKFGQAPLRSFLFSSPNLFDFELPNVRYDYFNWRSPVVVHFFPLDAQMLSLLGVRPRL